MQKWVWSLGRIRKVPWRRKWQPTPVFLPRKSHGQRSLVGYSPWGCKRVGHDLATKQQQGSPLLQFFLPHFYLISFYPTELGFICPPPSKAVSWHQVAVKKWIDFLCRTPHKESAQLMVRRPELPPWLSGKGFKRQQLGIRVMECMNQLVDILLIGWWWYSGILIISFLVSVSLGSLCLWSWLWSACRYHPPLGRHLRFCRIAQRYMSDCPLYPSSDLVLWLCSSYYYFSCLTAFPLFQHFPLL